MVKIKIFRGFNTANLEKDINNFLAALYDAEIDENSIFVDITLVGNELFCYIQWTVE